jgi:hypothetical protein
VVFRRVEISKSRIESVVNLPEIDALATLLEEGARSDKKSIDRFVEPGIGTLRRATSRRHHIIFGRRGSGKTILLLKVAYDLSHLKRPIAYVDLEAFKGHHYPDILISVLIASLRSFNEWLRNNCISTTTTESSWNRLLNKIIRRPKVIDKKQDLIVQIDKAINDLNEQLFNTDRSEIVSSLTKSESAVAERNASAAAVIPKVVDIRAGSSDKTDSMETSTHQEEYKRSKIDFLYRNIINYIDIFRRIRDITGGDSFLFLDDLYHIHRSDQAQLLDYFHRIAKGNGLWLKIGTIRHRSEWYVHGTQPVGLKLGDDADKIDLDLTLEQFSSTKGFLLHIVDEFITQASAPKATELLADDALDRLILASGGVARDLLGILRGSISEARERLKDNPKHYRGPRISVEDINLAAGTYGETKFEEFKRDTLEDQRKLEQEFGKLIAFTIEKTNTNCFLLDQDISGAEVELIQELVDLRLVHFIRSRVTVRAKKGRIFKAYMIDISQYTGARKRKDLEIIKFWGSTAREALRREQIVYDPE